MNKWSVAFHPKEMIKVDEGIFTKQQMKAYTDGIFWNKYIGSKYEIMNNMQYTEEDPVEALLNKK